MEGDGGKEEERVVKRERTKGERKNAKGREK